VWGSIRPALERVTQGTEAIIVGNTVGVKKGTSVRGKHNCNSIDRMYGSQTGDERTRNGEATRQRRVQNIEDEGRRMT